MVRNNECDDPFVALFPVVILLGCRLFRAFGARSSDRSRRWVVAVIL